MPYQLTMYADQAIGAAPAARRIFALYAQDRWTLNRLSLQGGLRFEHLGRPLRRAADRAEPVRSRRAIVFRRRQDGPLSLKDIQPRFGASYDVFGNGKTAAKFFMGRYVTTTNTVDEWLFYSPAGNGRFVTQTNRPWNDANGDFVPDCDLLNPAATASAARCRIPTSASRSTRSPSTPTRPADGTSASTAGT